MTDSAVQGGVVEVVSSNPRLVIYILAFTAIIVYYFLFVRDFTTYDNTMVLGQRKHINAVTTIQIIIILNNK